MFCILVFWILPFCVGGKTRLKVYGRLPGSSSFWGSPSFLLFPTLITVESRRQPSRTAQLLKISFDCPILQGSPCYHCWEESNQQQSCTRHSHRYPLFSVITWMCFSCTSICGVKWLNEYQVNSLFSGQRYRENSFLQVASRSLPQTQLGASAG